MCSARNDVEWEEYLERCHKEELLELELEEKYGDDPRNYVPECDRQSEPGMSSPFKL